MQPFCNGWKINLSVTHKVPSSLKPSTPAARCCSAGVWKSLPRNHWGSYKPGCLLLLAQTFDLFLDKRWFISCLWMKAAMTGANCPMEFRYDRQFGRSWKWRGIKKRQCNAKAFQSLRFIYNPCSARSQQSFKGSTSFVELSICTK